MSENKMYKIEVRPVELPDTNLRGFADITVNELVTIKNAKIIEGKNGLFVSMPSIKDKNGQYRPVCEIDKERRQDFNDCVIKAYEYTLEFERNKELAQSEDNNTQEETEAEAELDTESEPAMDLKM